MLTPPSNPKCPSCGTHLPLTIGGEQLDALFAMLHDMRSRLDAGDTRYPGCEKSPDPRIAQVAELEAEYSYLEPGARARLIQQRLNLSRSAYYRLRDAALSSPTSPRDSGISW